MKTIIEMAREADIKANRSEPYCLDDEELERFAELVRADEREACAEMAEEYMRESEGVTFGIGAAIRARGTHEK